MGELRIQFSQLANRFDCVLKVSVPYVGELRIQFDSPSAVVQMDYQFQYPMWVSFGFNCIRDVYADVRPSVSVPYVGELRIQC